MIEALQAGEGRISRTRSAHAINQNVRRMERPYERREYAPTLDQMTLRDLVDVESVRRNYEESNGVAPVQVKSPPDSNGAVPPLAPSERPAGDDSSRMPGDMLYEMGDAWLRIVIAAVATGILVLVIFLVSQGHERAAKIVTWPITSAAEYNVRITGDYTVEVKYAYSLNGRYITDWRSVGTYDDKRSAERHVERILSRVRSGDPPLAAIRYDPQNPSRSSFRMAVGTRLRWIITPIILASLAFIWLIAELSESAALSGHRRKANAEINGPILRRLLDRRAQRADGGPSRQSTVGIKTWLLKGLCRLRLHDGGWGYLDKGKCSQLRECRRCEAINVRTKHQPLWRYAGDLTCLRIRICRRCETVGRQRMEHEASSHIGDNKERCDRCGGEWEVSDGD